MAHDSDEVFFTLKKSNLRIISRFISSDAWWDVRVESLFCQLGETRRIFLNLKSSWPKSLTN